MKVRSIVLLLAVLLTTMLVLSACGGSSSGGGEVTVKGQITKVDVAAKTFTINSGGKDYDFKMVSSSKGDMNEIKQHSDQKKEVEVKYKGSSAPYEVISAD